MCVYLGTAIIMVILSLYRTIVSLTVTLKIVTHNEKDNSKVYRYRCNAYTIYNNNNLSNMDISTIIVILIVIHVIRTLKDRLDL